MRPGPRGGPGDFPTRLARTEHLLAGAADGAAAHRPLVLLASVLGHQRRRHEVLGLDPASSDRFPLLDLDALVPTVVPEVGRAVDELRGSVPVPLAEAGEQLTALQPTELAAIVETWFDDIGLVEPRLSFWIHVAAGPALERGAGQVTAPKDWAGAACPVCGGPPQASVIAEASGEFMAGSPRSLVCGRCANWWSFPRVTCVGCGEQDPRRIETYFDEDRPWARVDTCTTCGAYVKTFDLRAPGSVDVVPLVDDVATLSLDIWARDRGLTRPTLAPSGV